MRYVNETTGSIHCSRVGATVHPGRKSREINDLRDFVTKLVKDGHGMGLELSEGDVAAIDRLLSSSRPPSRPISKSARDAGRDPRNEQAVYDANEKYYILKRKLVSSRLEDRREREARINSESNFILPDGRPVGKEDGNVVNGMRAKEGTKVEPRYVERPQSPLDILAHNAKVSTERAQTAPLSGKAAVEAYRNVVPGMPNLPGIDRQIENLAREQAIASAQRAGMQPVTTSEMLESGARSNYGRK